MLKKFLAGENEVLASKRQVLTNLSGESIDRSGDIVEQHGIQTSGFMQTGGTVLWSHDPNFPVAKAIRIGVEGGRLQALVQFPPPGVSAKADETYGLIRAGVVNSASIGFRDLDSEPVNPRDPFGGQRYKRTELLEFSFVGVPASLEAGIVSRSLRKTTSMPKRQTRRPVLTTPRQRHAKFARLLQQSKAIGRPPVFCGDACSYAMQMARHLEAETLLRASAAGARLR